MTRKTHFTFHWQIGFVGPNCLKQSIGWLRFGFSIFAPVYRISFFNCCIMFEIIWMMVSLDCRAESCWQMLIVLNITYIFNFLIHMNV